MSWQSISEIQNDRRIYRMVMIVIMLATVIFALLRWDFLTTTDYLLICILAMLMLIADSLISTNAALRLLKLGINKKINAEDNEV